MDIKQGKVVINGKEFICSYGESLDGKRYYFVAGGELPNGRRIATLDVSEALNQTGGVIRTLGLVGPMGDVLVPLENKSVNTIDAKYIVFEKTTPRPDEVLNVDLIKSDPLLAAKFAEDTVHIKERMKEVAGPNAIDVYTNPEGAASVYTFDGESIVEGKYYNYIVKGSKGFAFATCQSEEIKSVGDQMENNNQNTVIPEPPQVMQQQPTTPVEPALPVAGEQPVSTVDETKDIEDNSGGSAPVIETTEPVEETPKEPVEPPREKTEKDKILDEAAEVIRRQKNKIKELTRIIKEQSNTIENKNKLEETLNKTIDNQSDIIANLEGEKRKLEIENAKINAGIINLKDVVQDAIEVLEDNEVEEAYTKTKTME